MPNVVRIPAAAAGGKMGEADFYTATTTGTSLEIDFADGYFQRITLAHSISTLTFANAPSANEGKSVVIQFVQDSSGSRTVAFSSASIKFDSGIAPTLSTGNDDIDVIGIDAVNDGSTTTYLGYALALDAQ